MQRVDLHLHSSASDGLFPPREVVRRAHGAGLAGIALTDHDTLSGLPEAAREAARLRLCLVPGCEISIVHGDRDLHLLAYFVDADDERMRALLSSMEALRRERVTEMVHRLNSCGLALTLEEVWAQAGGSSAVGRMHVARALVQGGYVTRLGEAFARHIGADCPAYVPKRTPPAPAVLDTVWETGAVPVLAHPGAYDGLDPEHELGGWDLGGVEAFHPAHSPQQEARLVAWAARRGWVITGGSDWHGEDRASDYLGCRSVALEVVAALRALRRRRTPRRSSS
ncbi:MAG: PHP domain-containing protein [Candidatus Eisenbacteria sp.]|nr:PHP domain-containing protein [Candidatus Eisenbacteria bacterium]